jgi:hypothetical protein
MTASPDMQAQDDSPTLTPLKLSAEWRSKTVTTDPPKLIPHEEWRLVIRLAGRSPFRLAVLMEHQGHVHWGLRPDAPSEAIEVHAHFFPHDWSHHDRVQVNFGWQRLTVADEQLKVDPRPWASLLLPASGATGQVIPVCEVRKHGIKLAVLPLAQQDTEDRRQDRWRLRPPVAEGLPPELRALASGRQHGTAPVTGDYLIAPNPPNAPPV